MTDIETIIDRFQHDKGQLVSILQDIQAEYDYLPQDVLKKVSQILDIPLSQVYSVATFFRAFSLKPRGRHLIKVCLGTACYVRGAAGVLDKIEQELGISPGENTKDGRFTLETINCPGACSIGAMAVIDEEYFGQLKADEIGPILKKFT